MSSSKKKQLRKEQNMTERQNAAASEAKQLKRYTLTFWIVIAVVLALFVGAVALNPVKNLVYRNTKAIQAGSHTLSSVELNYFYIDAINSYTTQFSSIISYLLDTSKPLDQQIADKETGKTWADSFLDRAKEDIRSAYALYDEAMKNNFELGQDDLQSIDNMMASLKVSATIRGYKNADSYLRAVYGPGATVESYREYCTVLQIADAYHAEYNDSLEYTPEDLRKFEAGSAFKYNAYTFASYYVAAAAFYQGGTKDDKGNTTYSDEEKKAGAQAAEKVANELAAGMYETLEDFDAAIKAAIAADGIDESKLQTASTKSEDVLYTGANSLFRDWLAGKVEPEEEDGDPTYVDRQEGDLTVIANKSGTGDKETISGYYVLRFGSINDNNYALKNVRHILVSFEGGKKNETTGEIEYSAKEKAAAKLKADNLLNEWKSGKMTEDTFAELAKKNSTDPGSKDNGGLYEDIYPGQMKPAFNDWCFDAQRKPGDTGIVETDVGYHIMYFVGDSETLYRDFMVTRDLRSDEITQWRQDLMDALKLDILTDKHVQKDLVLGGHSH